MSSLNNKGFTLVEVLTAVTVLAVGLVLVVQAMGRTQQAVRLSENLTAASHIAEEQITRLKLADRERGKPGYGEDGKQEYLGREFSWASSVEPFTRADVHEEDQISQISAEVKWQEAGVEKNLRAVSLVTHRKSFS